MRMRRKEMDKRRELVVQQLHALADDLEGLWKAATRDPAAERRKQRGWILLTGALGAASTMASRKALAKLWPILTGEPPPGTKVSEPSAQAPPESDEEIVPRAVTVTVVHLLEPVEVEHDQREGGVGLGRLRDGALELAHEGAAVRELRQRIVIGEIAHLLELRGERESTR